MFPPNLAVVECDTPDPKPLRTRDHLRLVDLTPTPVDASTPFPQSLLIKIVEGLIGIVAVCRFELELLHKRLKARPAPVQPDDDQMIGGRGW